METLPSTESGFKLHKELAIVIGAFFGGPLVAGFLAAKNFKRLEQYDKVKPTWIIAISAIILIAGEVYLFPDIEGIKPVISLIHTAITYYLVKHFQGKYIHEHIENGGQTYSVWRAVWIGLLGLAIQVTLIYIIAFALILTDVDSHGFR